MQTTTLITLRKTILTILLLLAYSNVNAQDYGNLPLLEKQKLKGDLELLHQGLDKFHSGMYWYTPKDSVDIAFRNANDLIKTNLNLLQFHKIIAPLVALSREDHTDIKIPKELLKKIDTIQQIKFLPFTVVFLGDKLYITRNGSDNSGLEENLEITKINGETPQQVVSKIGTLFASDGYIKSVKYADMEGFSFSRYYYYYYGTTNEFKLEFKDHSQSMAVQALPIVTIQKNVDERAKKSSARVESDYLQFKIIDSETAYIDIQTFSNSEIKQGSKFKTLKKFLKYSFKIISDKKIKNLIVDVSQNSGGNEGNEGLLYSYFGNNYQKYLKVRAKTQKALLDNGIDKPIKLKAYGLLERLITTKRMKDGSLERKAGMGLGLKAFKKEPENKFNGKTYVLISPVTYSGGSEFSNMMYSQTKATFIGQETAGGYLGNTSGYSRKLTLPHSKIEIYIPALQFIMNVKPKLPIGSGVKPHYKVIPTLEQYLKNENASLIFALKLINDEVD